MTIAGAVIGGLFSWIVAPWTQAAEKQREQIIAEYEARSKTPFDPPTIVTEETISRHGNLRITQKPGPDVPPEVVYAPAHQPTILVVLGATIGFLGSYFKLNWRR